MLRGARLSDQQPLPSSLETYVAASNIALAMSSLEQDTPLILVNRAFCDLTGYDAEDVVGKNCRFLQGEKTTEAQRSKLRSFIDDESQNSGRFPVLNYRKDGTPFLNLVFMTRLKDRRGTTRYFLASQFDMTTAFQRSELPAHDDKLEDALADIEQIGREFGLAMIGSAQIISDSIATLAKLSLDDDRA